MSFLYTLLLKLLYPTSLCLVLLACAVVFRKRKGLCRACFVLAVGVLLICGNGWIVRGLTRHLEHQFPPLSSQPSTLNPQPPQTDCIVVLSGGILPPRPPRPTIEVTEAGNRLLYGAYLFRKGHAPRIICTGNVATGGLAARPAAADMAEFLEMLGIPKEAIITELKAEDTHQHGVYLGPLLRENGYKRVLLVTSAMHMPRSVGVFKKLCPGIEIIPAPTDFRAVDLLPMPWYRHIVEFIPTPANLLDFSDAMHEYLGIAYYKLRGWM
jgi:uncharacterized SAM-binding protein YcdF (DUF218 family)